MNTFAVNALSVGAVWFGMLPDPAFALKVTVDIGAALPEPDPRPQKPPVRVPIVINFPHQDHTYKPHLKEYGNWRSESQFMWFRNREDTVMLMGHHRVNGPC